MNSKLKYFILIILTIFISIACYFSFASPDERVGAVDGEQPLYWIIDGSNCRETNAKCTLTISNEYISGSHYTYGTFYGDFDYYPAVIPYDAFKNSIVSAKVGSEGSIVSPKYISRWFNMFKNMTTVDLTYLDTSNVEDMSETFMNCFALTSLDVSSWNTSKVTSLYRTFEGVNVTTLDVSNWNTSNVTNMNSTFDGCKEILELDISNWDTSKVIDMSYMFYNCSKLTQLDVDNFATDNVTTMVDMFRDCDSLEALDLSGWNTSNVINMKEMFMNCDSLMTLDVSNFNTSNVEDMSNMFFFCSQLTSLDVSDWDTSNLYDMHGMFEYCSSLETLDVSNFKTSNVTNMNAMFYYCSNLVNLDVSEWNTSNVTTMSSIFRGCNSLEKLNLSDWDMSSVENISSMFYDCTSLSSLDVSNWNISKITSLAQLFYNCSKLKTLNLNSWDVTNITSMSYMLKSCSELETLNLSSWNTSKVTDMSYMFSSCSKLKNLNINNFNTSSVTTMSNMFYGCESLEEINLSSFNTSSVTSMSGMFNGCTSLESINVSNFDTSKVTNMSYMFNSCKNLINLDLSNFETPVLTEMSCMFGSDNKLQNLNISGFITNTKTDVSNAFSPYIKYITVGNGWGSKFTSSVWKNIDTGVSYSATDIPSKVAATYKNIDYLYWTVDGENCESENAKCTLTISNESIDGNHYDSGPMLSSSTSSFEYRNYKNSITKVITGLENDIIYPLDMGGWFSDFTNLIETDFSYIDTRNVTDFSLLFDSCSSLVKLDLSNWDTSKVTSLYFTFSDCTNLTEINLSGWNTSNVTDMYNTFRWCKNLMKLDLSSFDTSKVTNFSEMLYGCSKLYYLDMSNFSLEGLKYYYFSYPDSLMTVKLPSNFSKLPYGKWENPENGDSFYDDQHISILGGTYYCKSKLYIGVKDDTMSVSTMFPENSDSYSIISTGTSLNPYDYEYINNAIVGSENDIISFDMISSLFRSFALENLDITYVDSSASIYKTLHIYHVKNLRVGNQFDLTISNYRSSDSYNQHNNYYDYLWKNIETGEIYDSERLPKNVAATYSNMYDIYYYGIKHEVLYISNYNKFIGDEEYADYDSFVEGSNDGSIFWSWNYYNKIVVGAEDDIIKPYNMSYWFANQDDVENIDFTYLDTSNVVDMSYMFFGSEDLESLDVSSFDTSNVIDMKGMFNYISNGCHSSESNPSSSYKEFSINTRVGDSACKGGLTEIKGLENFDTSNVTDMYAMFANNSTLEKLDLSSFDTRKLECSEPLVCYNSNLNTCTDIFYDTNLTEIKVGEYWNLILPEGTWKNKETNESYDYDNIPEFTPATYVKAALYWAVNDNTLTISNYEIEGNVDSGKFSIDVLFEEETPWTKYMDVIENAIVGGEGDIVKPIFTANWFAGLENLIDINLTNLDTSNVVDMTYMFAGCINLEKIDVSNFDTTNVTRMVGMFEYMRKLKYLDLSSFDTSSVKYMYYMFMGDFDLEEIKGLENFDTSNAYDMERLFYGCESLTRLDLSSFNFDNVYCYNNMFDECYHLGEIKVNKNNVEYIREYLISPSSEYINGADGLWRNIDKDEYEAYNLPLNVSDTYYAVAPIMIHFDVDGGEEIPDLAKLTNNPLVLPREAKKDPLLEIITTIFETNGGNVINKIETSKITNYEFISFLDEASGITYNLGDVYNIDTETTFKIKWKNTDPIYETINLPIPERFGYKFIGWSRTADLTDMITGEYLADEDRTLYASWEEISYKFIRGSAEQTIFNDTDEYMLLANDVLYLKDLVLNGETLVLDEDYTVSEDKIYFTKKGLKYLKSLSSGKYELIATFNNTDKDARAIIYTEKIINPKTGYNRFKLVFTFILLITGITLYIYVKNDKGYEL